MIKSLFVVLITASFAFANLNVAVSILPQKTFVEAIGGDKVNVSLMVKPGNSPHTYEPKPSQMKDIAKADIYFTMDVEFEHVWLPKFKNQNKKMHVVDISNGIHKIEMEEHSHGDDHHDEHKEDKHHDHDEHAHHDKHDHDNHKGHDHHDDHKEEKHHDHEEHEDHDHEKHAHDDHDDHEHEGLDPHVWTSPSNVKIITKNILEELIEEDPKNESYYKANYKKFLDEIKATDKQIKKLLLDVETGTKFLVFHPAWGYFAKDYGLTQVAIEVSGKSPKPKQLMHLIEEAKEENIKAVFTAPEFSKKAAKQIAKEVGVPVVAVSPLNPKWSKNLINLAKAIANK